ncbi:hypothetical protein Deiofobo_0260 [Pseudomonas phage Deifobo]|nr:hypothetical protein Deiofobo_0260 [Pseudomonas phage Deifobo]
MYTITILLVSLSITHYSPSIGITHYLYTIASISIITHYLYTIVSIY